MGGTKAGIRRWKERGKEDESLLFIYSTISLVLQ
jgi:hypothetical protein